MGGVVWVLVLPLLPVGLVREDDSGAVCARDVLSADVANEVEPIDEAEMISVGHKFRLFERSRLVWDERGRVGRGLLVLLEGVASGGCSGHSKTWVGVGIPSFQRRLWRLL